MALPTDLQQSIDRMRMNAAIDELRLMSEQLANQGKKDAAAMVSARADTLLARLQRQKSVTRRASISCMSCMEDACHA